LAPPFAQNKNSADVLFLAEILIYFLDKKELSYKIEKVVENINFFPKRRF
jgi:hypothetical protein